MLHAPSCVELFLQCNRQFSLLVLRYGRGFLTFYYKIHSLSRYLFSAGSFLNTPVKFSLINSSFNQTVLSLPGSKNLLSHIHSRVKGVFSDYSEITADFWIATRLFGISRSSISMETGP